MDKIPSAILHKYYAILCVNNAMCKIPFGIQWTFGSNGHLFCPTDPLNRKFIMYTMFTMFYCIFDAANLLAFLINHVLNKLHGQNLYQFKAHLKVISVWLSPMPSRYHKKYLDQPLQMVGLCFCIGLFECCSSEVSFMS